MNTANTKSAHFGTVNCNFIIATPPLSVKILELWQLSSIMGIEIAFSPLRVNNDYIEITLCTQVTHITVVTT